MAGRWRSHWKLSRFGHVFALGIRESKWIPQRQPIFLNHSNQAFQAELAWASRPYTKSCKHTGGASTWTRRRGVARNSASNCPGGVTEDVKENRVRKSRRSKQPKL